MAASFVGEGTLTFPDGSVYVGTYSLCRRDILKFNGRGTRTLLDGTVLTGEFVGGKLVRGSIQYTSGSLYEGEVMGKVPNGKGKYTSHRGIVYDGEWRNGMYHGQGKFEYLGIKYEGEWKNGKRDGKGKETKEGAFVRTGEWYRDVISSVETYVRTPSSLKRSSDSTVSEQPASKRARYE